MPVENGVRVLVTIDAAAWGRTAAFGIELGSVVATDTCKPGASSHNFRGKIRFNVWKRAGDTLAKCMSKLESVTRA